jgi:hypothetical protein
MDKGWFDCFTNQNLRLAFHYRMIGDYKKAKVHLKLAAQRDDDGVAWFVLGNVYKIGGFGIRRNDSKIYKSFSRSYARGCLLGGAMLCQADDMKEKVLWNVFKSQDVFAMAIVLQKMNCSITEKELINKLVIMSEANPLINHFICEHIFPHEGFDKSCFIERAIELGDAFAFDLNEKELLRASKQKYDRALVKLSSDYYLSGYFELAFNIALKSYHDFGIVVEILKKFPDNKWMHYKYGKKHGKGYVIRSYNILYYSVTSSCRSSVLCFIWCAYKKSKVLSKDIATLIGKMVYRSRSKDIELWDTATVPNKMIKKK